MKTIVYPCLLTLKLNEKKTLTLLSEKKVKVFILFKLRLTFFKVEE